MMSGLKVLTERVIGDIILCDPITTKGREALGNLGLDDKITRADFLNDIRVLPKYDRSYSYVHVMGDPSLLFDYSITEMRFKEYQNKLEYFEKKLLSNTIEQFPLIIFGTAGNGKSIEVNYQLEKAKKQEMSKGVDYLLYDFEETESELIYKKVFRAPDTSTLWLVCVKLLEGFMKCVRKFSENVSGIMSNYTKYFINNTSAEEDEINLFLSVADFQSDDPTKIEKVFEFLIKRVEKDDPKLSIDRILKATMDLLYCNDMTIKHFIVFDNIEHFIKVNDRNIPIPNSTLSELYKIVGNVVSNARQKYDRIAERELWKAFKIILVLRRTSGKIIGEPNMQHIRRLLSIGNDYTNHFDLWRIWEKKKITVWENYLKSQYDPCQSEHVLFILQDMMNDKPGEKLGTTYQDLISPLMNSGLRRNARAQAHASMQVWDILEKNNRSYISYDTFIMLVEKADATRYIYRCALLEIQIRWMIASIDSDDRFKLLLLGELEDKPKPLSMTDDYNKLIMSRKVKWKGDDYSYATLTRRVLSYLSNFPDTTAINEDGVIRRAEIFETKSLYDLMKVILLNPGQEEIASYNNYFIPLAKVLTGIGNVEQHETKSAPMVILDVDDERNNSEQGLSIILKEIWESGEDASLDTGKFNRSKYGVRLTESGETFLIDVHPSFYFFSALFCNEEVPLFFLKDTIRIKYVIKKVYSEASKLCLCYEDAARRFCGMEYTLKDHSYNYLNRKNENIITFRSRVKELHIRYLSIYETFIWENADIIGINDIQKQSVIKHIENYINEYKKWKEEAECF